VNDPDALLKRHKPVVRYDSHESYFADSAVEWADSPRQALRRGLKAKFSRRCRATALRHREHMLIVERGALSGGLQVSQLRTARPRSPAETWVRCSECDRGTRRGIDLLIAGWTEDSRGLG
jgi:hypothetical protein